MKAVINVTLHFHKSPFAQRSFFVSEWMQAQQLAEMLSERADVSSASIGALARVRAIYEGGKQLECKPEFTTLTTWYTNIPKDVDEWWRLMCHPTYEAAAWLERH